MKRSIARFARCLGSILVLAGVTAFVVGCDGSASKPKPAASTDHHDHPDEGPHHGQLIELGNEEYHAEMIHDDAAHKITIYVLDGKAAKNVSIAEKELTLNVVAGGKTQQYKLPAVPQSDDPAGQASRFELTDQALCEALDDSKTTGRLNLTIAGKPYSGEVHHAGEHDHKH